MFCFALAALEVCTRSSERTTAGGSHRSPTEPPRLFDDSGAQALAPLTRLFCQPPDRSQTVFSRTGRRHSVAALNQPPLLNVRVVEIAQHTLQRFQGHQHTLHLAVVTSTRRHIDEVPKFLGVD